MLNQCVLVGRIISPPKRVVLDSGCIKIIITLDIKRNTKNPDTLVYESDLVSVCLWETIDAKALDVLREGNVVGVKGRIQQTTMEAKEGMINIPEICCEKLTFINSNN